MIPVQTVLQYYDGRLVVWFHSEIAGIAANNADLIDNLPTGNRIDTPCDSRSPFGALETHRQRIFQCPINSGIATAAQIGIGIRQQITCV